MDLFPATTQLWYTSRNRFTGDLTELLDDTMVGLFFCASWCQPCHDFVDVLATFWASVKQRKGRLVIICVPCDTVEDEMWNLCQQMPEDWLTLTLADRKIIKNLVTTFEVGYVPKLVVVTSSKHVLSKCGRKDVQDKGIAAYRAWYDVFKPPGQYKAKLKGAVFAVMTINNMNKPSDESSQHTGDKQPAGNRVDDQEAKDIGDTQLQVTNKTVTFEPS